mgnify:CR=1 FL=1
MNWTYVTLEDGTFIIDDDGNLIAVEEATQPADGILQEIRDILLEILAELRS